jgi:hypothetical protein
MSGGWTPGPWRINRIAATNVESASGRGVASTGGFQDGTDDAYLANQANARLIAAAPELVEELMAALDEREQQYGALPDGAPHWSVRARALLARIDGETA